MDWVEGWPPSCISDPLSAGGDAASPRRGTRVAHRVERKVTPLATYLLGLAVGSRMADGVARRRGPGGRDPTRCLLRLPAAVED